MPTLLYILYTQQAASFVTAQNQAVFGIIDRILVKIEPKLVGLCQRTSCMELWSDQLTVIPDAMGFSCAFTLFDFYFNLFDFCFNFFIATGSAVRSPFEAFSLIATPEVNACRACRRGRSVLICYCLHLDVIRFDCKVKTTLVT